MVWQRARQVPDKQNGDEALIIATQGGENPSASGQTVTGPPPRISASAHRQFVDTLKKVFRKQGRQQATLVMQAGLARASMYSHAREILAL